MVKEAIPKSLLSPKLSINDFSITSKYTAVFNGDDIEGIGKSEDRKLIINEDELIKKLSENMNVKIILDGNDRAFYRSASDEIHLPLLSSFNSEYAFKLNSIT